MWQHFLLHANGRAQHVLPFDGWPMGERQSRRAAGGGTGAAATAFAAVAIPAAPPPTCAALTQPAASITPTPSSIPIRPSPAPSCAWNVGQPNRHPVTALHQ